MIVPFLLKIPSFFINLIYHNRAQLILLSEKKEG